MGKRGHNSVEDKENRCYKRLKCAEKKFRKQQERWRQTHRRREEETGSSSSGRNVNRAVKSGVVWGKSATKDQNQSLEGIGVQEESCTVAASRTECSAVVNSEFGHCAVTGPRTGNLSAADPQTRSDAVTPTRSGCSAVMEPAPPSTSTADPELQGTGTRGIQRDVDTVAVSQEVSATTFQGLSAETIVLDGQQASRDDELDERILELMGSRLIQERNFAAEIHKDLAIRWKDILIKGLSGEDKKKLLEKYPPPANCTEIVPPKLNVEVKVSLQEVIVKKDVRVVARQARIAACLAALGKSLSVILKANRPEDLVLLEILSDVARLLADIQHDDSLIRRSLILSNLNTALKDTLNSSPVNEWLFGNNLEEQLKTAKLLERSSKNLRPEPKGQKPNSKNSKGPPNRPFYKRNPQTLGGRQQQQQQYAGSQRNWRSNKSTRGQNRGGYQNQGPKK